MIEVDPKNVKKNVCASHYILLDANEDRSISNTEPMVFFWQTTHKNIVGHLYYCVLDIF